MPDGETHVPGASSQPNATAAGGPAPASTSQTVQTGVVAVAALIFVVGGLGWAYHLVEQVGTQPASGHRQPHPVSHSITSGSDRQEAAPDGPNERTDNLRLNPGVLEFMSKPRLGQQAEGTDNLTQNRGLLDLKPLERSNPIPVPKLEEPGSTLPLVKKPTAASVSAVAPKPRPKPQVVRKPEPPVHREPVYGPEQMLTLCVHLRNAQAWPNFRTRLKNILDSSKGTVKLNLISGDYYWVVLTPAKGEPDAYARKVNFAKVVAVHVPQRLIYLDAERPH